MPPAKLICFGMKEKSVNYKALIVWILIGFSFGWVSNGIFKTEMATGEIIISQDGSSSANLSLFWDVWSALEKSYVDTDKLNTQNQIYGAIGGMVNSLGDPYTVFMTPEETNSFHQSLGGELEGIGAELTVKDGLLMVISPLKGSPAEKQGLLPGDYIYMVDGKLTSDMTLFEAIKAIRGAPNTDVELTVVRKDSPEPIIMKITREKINVPSVELEYKDDIAVLSISQFGDSTYAEFEEAVSQLLLKPADGLVIDLRLNGGGYLDTSVEMMSEFFKDKVKAVIVKRRDQDNEIMYTKGNGKLTDIKLVVLINEGSASASEILAGAMQDYKRAVVMGVKSFGKGSVQELSSLSDGSSLRMTIAKWYTPNDRTIDHTGITPDTVVEMESSKIGTDEDTQLQTAIDYLKKL